MLAMSTNTNCATVLALWCGGKSFEEGNQACPSSTSSSASSQDSSESEDEESIGKDVINSHNTITTVTVINTTQSVKPQVTANDKYVPHSAYATNRMVEIDSSSGSSNSSEYSSDDEAQDVCWKTNLQFARSVPDTVEKKVFSQYSLQLNASLRANPPKYSLTKISTDHTTNVYRYSSTPTPSKKRSGDPVSVLFYQLTSIKKLDTASQINVILDQFLTDYPLDDTKRNGTTFPYKYLFRNDIIGNLIFGWNLGIKKTDCALITYSVQSLCKFAHRIEFRAPFLNKHGIRFIEETLSIPPSPPQAPASSPNDMQSAPNTFEHILAVLKLTSDICKSDIMDPDAWRSSKMHQKILSTMKRDYGEEEITKSCEDTLMTLCVVSYAVAEDVIHNDQIHEMIDSFLESTATAYFKDTSRLLNKQSLRRQDSQLLLPQPLFVHNNTEPSDTSLSKKKIKHEKRKNLLQLQEDAKNAKPVKVSAETLTIEEDIRESSEYLSSDEEDEYETGTETESDTEWEVDQEDDKSHISSHESHLSQSPLHDTNAQLSLDIDQSTVSLHNLTPITSPKYLTSDDAASDQTNVCYGEESEDSILSLKEYDAMVEEMEKKNAVDELCGDYHEEEKSHVAISHKATPGVPQWNDIQIHSVNIDKDAMVTIDIELQSHQLLYINSLFHILYKIITLKRPQKGLQIRIGRSSKKTAGKSFMEMLENRRKRARAMSGDTVGELSHKDAVCMSDSETIYRKTSLKQINHEKNKLLESFFASLSFKNLFKLLKYYQLNTIEESSELFDFNSVRDDDTVSIEKLACKILRKLLSYSQIINDKLLIDDELDVIGILVTLLFRNPSNIDLIIYILDIFCKITKNNDAIRDLLLTPDNFDKLLRALDPWWMLFIHSTERLTDGIKMKPIEKKKTEPLLHLQLFHSVSKVLSVESISVAEKRDRLADESELQIEVTIAMLKFFKLLSESNALDMVEYGINDRILVLLDYYLNISLKYDPYQQTKDVDGNLDLDMNYSFVFSHDKHQQCLSLCLECIQNLATDINMLLEFVFNKTVEKLTRICWSFRDHTQMMKKCCDVINKLLKLEQSCKQIANQNVLQPLIHTVEHIFEKTFISTYARAPQLLIASELFPAIYTNEVVSADEEEDIELVMKYNACEDDVGSQDSQDSEGSEYSEGSEDSEDEDAYDDDGSVQFVGSEDEHNDDEIRGKDDTVGRRVRFHRYDLVQMNKSMSFSNAVTPTHRSHEHLRDLKDIFNVLMSVSYVDKLCVEIIESNLMLLLIECIANKSLMIHNHMMISLIVSDLLQHLTKNKKGAETLIHSNRFQIVPYIVDAIENNINNRGVVLKYLRALIHLKDANHERFKKQLEDNECIGFLKKVGAHFHEMINVNEIIEDYEDDNEDKLDIDNDDDGDNEEI